jgi:TRAP-type mannitol/chloroaromatic compound transport system substrate-binding protein
MKGERIMDLKKMRDRSIGSIVLITTVSFLVGTFCTPSASAAPLKMRIQTAVPNVSNAFKELVRFADNIRVMSDGQLEVEVLPDGAIVPAARIPDAVNTGVVEAGATYAQYFAGKHISASLFGAPPAGGGSKIGMDEFAHMCWLIYGPGRELYEEFYREIIKMDLVSFPVAFTAPDSVGWFAKPIESLKDLQGRRYRSGPGLIAETWKKIGVPATFLPGGEILPAGQRGVIDGAQWGFPADDIPMGFHQVWKHYYIQGAHFPTSTWVVLINRDFWNKLTPASRRMMEIAGQSSILSCLHRMLIENGIYLKEATEKHGVKVHDVPPDIFEAYMKGADEVLEKYTSDPFFKRVLDSQREYMDLIRPWWKASLQSFTILNEGASKK